MLSLLSSTRSDPYLARLQWNNHKNVPCRYFLLDFHLDRLQQAAEAHEWPEALAALSYDVLFNVCEAAVGAYTGDAADAFKIRITLSKTGELAATASPVPALLKDPTVASFSRPLTDSATLYGPPLTLYLDTEPTPPAGLLTSTKTTERTLYDAARTRVGLTPTTSNADVILYTPDDHITEASVANVAFYHAHTWVTPPLSTGCLPGVLRRWLLQHKRIREAQVGELTKSALHPGDWVLLFNSVHGCRLGRITALPEPEPEPEPASASAS